ncbi:MAG: DUF2341 domain-containing protein, partial [Methanobacteriaceae archaeon]|nr:DUF2341 domain-containing protein [Methanobacteriaceae archaeon]
NSENEVACSFDLRGKQAGDWDLVITNPNTQFRRLERGFKVEAAINRLSVVTKEQTIRPDLPSSIIIIQAQDYNGNPAKTLEPINISLNSNGEFSLEKESWTFVDSLIIKSGEHEAGIYYKNSEEESDTLSFSNEIFGQISQSINIDENAPKTWRFDNLNEYIYDNSKIEVSNSLAKLKDIGREGDFYAINFDLENKNNFIQEDVKGFITRWEYDSGSLGHFDYPINDKIKAGTILDINGKLYTILKIDGDGTHARAVELDEFVPTGEILHIYGINFKNTNIALGGGGYTRLISFSKATPYNDYLLRVELDASFDYTKTQVNGEDLRFFVNETELDYYIDTWNENSYSLILVKIPEEGTLSINMAYGNEDVLPKSNPEIISNLLAGYDFDDSNEIGKDIFDLRDGVNTSSTLLTTGCVSKSCLNLNGSAYITVPNFNIGNSSFVSFWAKSSSYGGTMPFSFNGDNYSSGPDLYFTGSAAYWNTGDGSTNKFSGSSYPDSKWHHFTVINDEKTNAKLYIDGILKGTAIFKNNKTETNNTFFIGRYDSGGYNFVGQIDKFKIYNNLIPETNIEDDYYSGLKQLLNNGTITQTEFNQRASTLNYDIVATASQETNVTIPVSSYYSTTLGQFNVSDFTHVLGVEITQNVPENTSTKFLVSFDQRQTWRYWNETKWVESSLKNIEANGMNKNLVESLTQDIWESDFGFNKEKTQAIDFAVSLRTTNASHSPSLSKIIINYKKEGYDEASPFIKNKQGLPYSELLAFTDIAGANNRGVNTYQISNNGEDFYFFNDANWALVEGGVEQSNIVDIVNDNIAQFVTDVGTGEFYFKLFLNTGAHTDPAIIDDVSLSYIYHTDPLIESISANLGVNDSVSNITIYGSNFVNGLIIKLVKEGAQDILAKNINFISNSEVNINFDLSLASLGLYDLILINPDKRSFTVEGAFTINDASPIITEIIPSQGTNNSVVNIRINGSNFDQGLKARLIKSGEQNIDCEVLESASTSISCNFDLVGKTRGLWDVEVINPSSLSSELKNAFTLIPSIYKLSFVTSEKELRPNKSSSKIIVEAHDYAGNAVNVLEDTNILISSTSLTQKFSVDKTSWQDSLTALIPLGSSSITFYYKDEAESNFTLSAIEDPDLGWLDAEQNIIINSNAPAKWHFDVYDEYTFDDVKLDIFNSKVVLKNIEQEKQDVTLSFDSSDDYMEEDVKGNVTYWYQDEGNHGHFNNEAINKLLPGTKLFINGIPYSIIEINNGGTPYKSVKLSSQAPSGIIDKIIGTKFANGKLSLNGGTLGTKESPGLSCLDILINDSSTPSGIYWINPTQTEGEEFQAYCDMTTNGGGWTLALLNSPYATPVVPNWNDVVNKNNITGNMENGLNSGFDSFLGVKYWNLLGNKLRIEQGSSSTSLTRQAYYDFYLDTSNYYALKLSNESITLGGASSGFYSSHNNKPLTTYDADHDANSGNCATYYGNTAWWYTSCWSGSFWGGGTGGSYQNKPYWTGSSSDYYNWGAIWIKDVSETPTLSLGTLFPESLYTIQTKSQINTEIWDHLLSIQIDEETPLNTNIKYLISFDNKETWRYFNGTSWEISHLNNIEIDGMTKTGLEALTKENLESAAGFVKSFTQSIDFAISLKTTDRNVAPSMNQISINYEVPAYDASNQTIVNNTREPYSTLSSFGETLGQNNEGTITYQLSNNGSSFYYFNGENWVSAQGYENSN